MDDIEVDKIQTAISIRNAKMMILLYDWRNNIDYEVLGE